MPFIGRGGSSPPSDTNSWGFSPAHWENSRRLRRVPPGGTRDESPQPRAAACAAPKNGSVDWAVSRVVIASVDTSRRVSVGRLELPERRFVVASWFPFLVLDPASTNTADHIRAVDSLGRLQLRPADVEVLGVGCILVALTLAGSVVLARGTTLTEIALRAATNGLERP